MTEQDKEQLNIEISHIFESGANHLRIFENLYCSCISSDSDLQIARPLQTVTSQHPNRGKKIPAFIIKVIKKHLLNNQNVMSFVT